MLIKSKKHTEKFKSKKKKKQTKEIRIWLYGISQNDLKQSVPLYRSRDRDKLNEAPTQRRFKAIVSLIIWVISFPSILQMDSSNSIVIV